MVKNFSFPGRGRCLRLVCLGLCYLAQFGCGAEPFSSGSGLYSEAQCPPAEVVSQLRKALSLKNVYTTEAVPNGKGLSFFADSVIRDSRRERMVRYKLVVLPVENANKSTISLQLEQVQSQGLLEKVPYKEENTTSVPEVAQEIMGQVQTICRSGQTQ